MFGISFVLKILVEVIVLCLNHHLLLIQVYLYVLESWPRKLYFVCYLLTMIRGRVRTIYSQEYILCSNFLPVHSLEERLLSRIMLTDWKICYFLLSPNLMLRINRTFGSFHFILQFFLLIFFVLGLVFFSNFGLNLGVRLCNLFLIISSNLSRINHTAWIRI